MAYDGTLKFDTSIVTDGFQSGINKISSIAGTGMKATTAVLGAAATAITGIGTAAVKVGMDFDAGMSKVSAISGATGTELQQLREKAIEMGNETKFSAIESAQAFEFMSMAGWKTEDMLGGIEGVMNLAAASGEDLARTSDIVTDAMTAFGLKADETTTVLKDGLEVEVANASHFADVLAQTSASANTNVGMLGESFKYVAPVAGALGMSVEDTSVALGLMANVGIKASQSGTALRTILTNMAKPTDAMAAAMDALGVSLENDDGSMKSLMEVMQDLRKGFGEGSISSEEFNEKLEKLNEQFESGDLKEEKYQEVLEDLTVAMYGTTGAEKAKYAAMLAGKEGMSGLLAIVNASEEDFNKLTSEIANCTGAAEEMAETMNDNLAGQLTILKGQLETFGIALSEGVQEPLKDTVKEAQTMVSELKTAFSEGGFEGLIDAAGDVLAQVVQMIMDAAPQLIETAKELCIQFINSIMEHSSEFGFAGAELVTTLANAILELSGEMWSAAVTLFTQFLSSLSAQLPQIIETGKKAVEQFGQALVDNAPSILSSAKSIALTIYEGLTSGLPQLAESGAEILNQLAEGIKNNLSVMIPSAMSALMEFSGTLRESAGQLVDAGLNLIMALAQSLIDNIPVFIETVPTIITNIAGIINDNAPKLLATGIKIIGQLALGLIQAIPTLVANIPKIIEAIVSVFTAFNWVQLGAKIITFIKNGVQSLASELPKALKSIGQTAKEWLSAIQWKTLGKDIIDLIKIGIESLLTAIPKVLKGIGQTAVKWFKEINWAEIGKWIINGIITGLNNALSGLYDAITGIASGALDKIKSALGIASPSKVFRDEVGKWIPPGITEGIKGSMPKLLNTTEQEMKQLANKMQATVKAETSKVTIEKVGRAEYEQAIEDRRSQRKVDVTGKLEGDRPIEVHTNLYIDKKKFAKEVTPAINHEMYKIDETDNNRGRGN